MSEGFRVSIDALPMQSPDGTLGGAIVVLRDITETQHARAALKHHDEMCRALVENVQDVISLLDAEGTVRYVSPSIKAALGYAPEELIGRNAFDLLHPEDLPRILEIFRAGIEKPGAVAGEDFRVRHKDGSWRFFAGVSKSLLENPEVGGVVISARDVTGRLREEQQALFHKTLLNHLRSAVVALDTEGRIIYWNNFAWKLYQWAPEEVVGKRLLEVTIPPPHRDMYEEVLQTVRTTEYWEGEFPKRRRDGTVFPSFLTGASVRGREGDLLGYVGVSMDISERKEAEERLRASREQLRRLAARVQSIREAERARIARDIHDDLGQQLTALRIQLFRLVRDASAKAAAPKLVASIRSTIGLVDNSMESVRRIAAELRPSILDDLGLVAAVEWQLQEFHSRTRVRCVIDRTDENLLLEPERSTGVFRIFQEVLTNVARHAHAREVKVSIKRKGGCLLLDVQDNGQGITRQQITAPGSLGLLGMRERALRLGGDLSVRGVRGKGTRVSLRVPLADNGAENTDSG
jgi:PAS domain S-box-containing protein